MGTLAGEGATAQREEAWLRSAAGLLCSGEGVAGCFKGFRTGGFRKSQKERKGPPAEEGLPLVGEEDFPIDVEASIDLFRSLCRLGSAANPHVASQVEKIEQAFHDGTMDLKALFTGGGKEQAIEKVAADRGLDRQVLSFLVRSSTRPSIEAGREQLRGEFDPETWRKTRCPVCGSRPPSAF